MTRKSPHIIATRISPFAHAAVRVAAATHGCDVSTLLRRSVALLSAVGTDPDKQLAAVADLLGIPGASPEAIRETIDALIAALAPSNDDPLAASPDAPPPAQLTRLSTLSAADRAKLAKRGVTTEAQWTALKNTFPRTPTKARK